MPTDDPFEHYKAKAAKEGLLHYDGCRFQYLPMLKVKDCDCDCYEKRAFLAGYTQGHCDGVHQGKEIATEEQAPFTRFYVMKEQNVQPQAPDKYTMLSRPLVDLAAAEVFRDWQQEEYPNHKLVIIRGPEKL